MSLLYSGLPVLLPPLTSGGGTPAPGTPYPNGFLYRRRLRVAGAAIKRNIGRCPIRFDETLTSFRTVANGGRLQSSQAWDVRFETAAGAKLGHEIETYNAATGRLAGYFTVPSFTSGQDSDLWLYYGKAGLTASEANPATAWERALGSWRMPDGKDMTSGGRDLTLSGVSAGAGILGMGAGSFGTASYAELGNSALGFFNNITEFSTSLWLQITSRPNNANILRVGGSVAGSARHTIWFEPSADQFSPAVTWPFVAGAKLGTANPQVASPANLAAVGTFFLAVVAGPNKHPALLVNGQPVGVSTAGSAANGSTSIVAGDVLRLGATFGSNPESMRGQIGRLVIWSNQLTPEFVELFWRSQADPRSVYAIGDEDTPSVANRSPIFAPRFAQVAAGASVSVPILSSASDPDGGGLTPSLVSGQAPSLGSASILDDAVRYTAAAGTGGRTDRFEAQVADSGGKAARGAITISITSGSAGPGPVPTPGVELPTPSRRLAVGFSATGFTSFDSLAAAYGAAQPGDHIYLNESANAYPGLTANRAGTASQPIVIRARSDTLGALGVRCGPIQSTAADNWLWGINFGASAMDFKGARGRALRCRWTGYNNGTSIQVGISAADVFIGHCEILNSLSRGISWDARGGGVRGRLFRTLLKGFRNPANENAHEGVQFGRSNTHSNVDARCIMEYCLFDDMATGKESENLSIKSSNNRVRFVTIQNGSRNLNVRHGEGNAFWGCWAEAGCRIMFRDRNNKMFGCKAVGNASLRVQSGNVTADQWDAIIGTGTQRGQYVTSENGLLVGCDAPTIIVGDDNAGNGEVRSRGTVLEACRINGALGASPTVRFDVGPTVRSTTTRAFPTPVKVLASQVGPASPWQGLPAPWDAL